MKILYRILVILLCIILFLIIGMPIVLIISHVIYLYTGRANRILFDMYLKGLDYLIDTAEMLAKKGE